MNAKEQNIFKQFNALIGSNIPEEYKSILQNFQQQNTFYQQLLQNIDSGSDLSKFWELPDALGFNIDTQGQPEWLKAIFDINHLQPSSNDPFSHIIEEIPLQIKDTVQSLQEKMAAMASLHNELSQLAMHKFQTLNDEGNNLPNEQLCAHWLKAGEEAFAEISQREDYVRTQSEVIEALGQIKNTQSTFVEQLSNTWGLPSQQSIQDLQKGLHQLRIEFAEYKEETSAVIDELKTTIRKLR